MAYNDLLKQLYDNRPDLFTVEDVDSLQQIGIKDFQPIQQVYDWNIGNTISNVLAGFVEGFTTLPAREWLGVKTNNSVDEIAGSIGSLLGFIGFIPGVGSGARIGLSSLIKAGSKTFLKGAVSKLPPSILVTSWPMAIANITMKKLTQTGLGASLDAVKFLQQGTIGRQMLKTGMHLGIASGVGAAPIYDVSWDSFVNKRLEGFGYGVAFGAGNAALGNLISKGGKIDFSPSGKTTEELTLLGKTDKVLAETLMAKDKLANNVIRGISSAAIFGMPSTVRGAPLEMQVYEYLLNGFFGFRELSLDQRKAKELSRPYAETAGGILRDKLLRPKETFKDTWDTLSKGVKDELEYQAEVEFGGSLSEYSQSEYALLGGLKDTKIRLDKDLLDGKITLNQHREYTKGMILTDELVKGAETGVPEETSIENAKDRIYQQANERIIAFNLMKDLGVETNGKTVLEHQEILLKTADFENFLRDKDLTVYRNTISDIASNIAEQIGADPKTMLHFKKVLGEKAVEYIGKEGDPNKFISETVRDFGVDISDNLKLDIRKFFNKVSQSTQRVETIINSNGEFEDLTVLDPNGLPRRKVFMPQSEGAKLIPNYQVVKKVKLGNGDEIDLHRATELTDWDLVDYERPFLGKEEVPRYPNLTAEKILTNAAAKGKAFYYGKKQDSMLIFGDFLVKDADIPQNIELAKKYYAEDYKKSYEDWNGNKTVHDKLLANDMEFMRQFNFPDKPMEDVLQVFKANKEQFILSPKDLNKRGQLLDAWSQKLSVKEMMAAVGKPKATVAILKAVNSDGTNHDGTGKVETYFIEKNGKLIEVPFNAHYDGGVLVRQKVYDASAETSGYSKFSSALKGIAIESGQEGELGKEALGAFMSKRAMFRADDRLNKIMEDNDIDMFESDTSAKQRGLRPENDNWSMIIEEGISKPDIKPIDTPQDVLSTEPIQSITQEEKVSPRGSNEVIEQSMITRQDLKNNPDKVYLFGDNLLRKGMGGQAQAMRGEPNAIGIPTKKKPSKSSDSYFTDTEYDSNIKAIDEAFARIPKGKTIVLPEAGIGTGLADLQKKAPKTFEYLQSKIEELKTTRGSNEATDRIQVKGGFENKGKGTPLGDGKDKAMRKVADGFIGEIFKESSSSATSRKELGSPDNAKVVMLARNKEFVNKPLKAETKQQILDAHNRGVEFVVGDMPGVDSQFIDYLNEIGAKYTIYHTGKTPRIKPETTPKEVIQDIPTEGKVLYRGEVISYEDPKDRSSSEAVFFTPDRETAENYAANRHFGGNMGEESWWDNPSNVKEYERVTKENVISRTLSPKANLLDLRNESKKEYAWWSKTSTPQGIAEIKKKYKDYDGIIYTDDKFAGQGDTYMIWNKKVLNKTTIPKVENIQKPVTELSEPKYKTFELKWDSITIDNADVIDLNKPVRVAKQLLSNIHDPVVQDIARKFFLEKNLNGIESENKKFAEGDENVNPLLLSLENRLKIITSNKNTKAWRDLHKEILNLDEADIAEDGISSPETIADVENVLKLRGTARRILESVEVTPGILQWPGVSDYYQAALNNYIFKSALTPKISNAMTSVFRQHSPTDYSTDGTKINIKQGEIWYGKDAREKRVTIEVNGKKEKGTLGELWDKYKDNDDAFSFLVMRPPADSASGVRVVRMRGFGDWQGTSGKLHPEDYMAMGGADNDIDKLNTYFRSPKEMKDYYSKYKDQWWEVKDGKRIFKPTATTMLKNPKPVEGYMFSPKSIFEANRLAAQGNNKLGFGLSLGNRLITLVNTLKKAGVNKDRNGNLYTLDISKLIEGNREIVNNSADSANGFDMMDMNSIRKTLQGRTVIKFATDKKGREKRIAEVDDMRDLDNVIKGKVGRLSTNEYGEQTTIIRKGTLEEVFETLNKHRGKTAEPYQNVHYQMLHELGKYSVKFEDWKGTNHNSVMETIQTAFNPNNPGGYAKDVTFALGRDLSVTYSNKQRDKIMKNWEKNPAHIELRMSNPDKYRTEKQAFQNEMYVQDYMDIASAFHIISKTKGITKEVRNGIIKEVKRFKDELFDITKGKTDITERKGKLTQEMLKYAETLTDPKQRSYFEAMIVSSLKPQMVSRETMKAGVQTITNSIGEIANKYGIKFNDFSDLINKMKPLAEKDPAIEQDISTVFTKIEEIKNIRKGWYESNIDTFFLNNDIVTPQTLADLGKYYNKIVESTFMDQKLPEKEQALVEVFKEPEAQVRHLNDKIAKKLSTFKDNETVSKDMEDLRKRFSDFLYKRPELIPGIADRYSSFSQARTGAPKDFNNITRDEFRSFVEDLERIDTSKNGLKLSMWDYMRLPQWIVDKHKPYDENNTVSVERYVYDREVGKFLKTALKVPMSRFEKNFEASLMLTKQKGQAEKEVENWISEHPITKILDKIGEDGDRIIEYIWSKRESRRDRGTGKEGETLYYTEKFKKIDSKANDLKAKLYPIVENGKQRKVSFDELTSIMDGELTKDNAKVWKEKVLGGADSFEEALQIHMAGYIENGWLNYERFTADMTASLFNKNKIEDIGIALRDYIVHNKLAQMHEFAIVTPEGMRTVKAADLPTQKEISQFLNDRMNEKVYLTDDTGKVTEKARYPFLQFKHYTNMDPFWFETYMPHLDIPQKVREKKLAEIKLIKDEKIRLAEEAKLESQIGNDYLEDNGTSEGLLKIFEGQLEPADIETLLTRKSSNLMSRDDIAPMDGYSMKWNAIQKYQKGLVADYWNGMTAILLHRNVDQFVKETMLGKNTIGKENAKPWAAFMRQGIREIIGYPSTLPTEWVTNPEYKIKGNPYWFVTEDYWARKATVLDRFFGVKGETNYKVRAAKVSRKIASLSNAEGKWSMMSLLFSPKTYLVNLGTANNNTVVSTGWRHWKNAGDIAYLKTINPDWKSWADAEKAAYDLGGIESFIKSIAPLSQQFKSTNARSFFTRSIELFKTNPEARDASLYEIAKQEGLTQEFVDKSAYFMRQSERKGRVRAWLAHYLKAREVFDATPLTFDWNDPWLIEMANKGVRATQFLYDDAARPQFARTNLGKIFTRFQLFAMNSIAWRRDILGSAVNSGWNKDTEEYKRFQRLATADLFVMSLASLLPYSIFNSAMPPPFNYLEGSVQFLFGDREERAKAFYGVLPYPANIVQPVLPPSSRVITSTLAMLMTGDTERYIDYHLWTFFPFGRFANDTRRSIENPYLLFEKSFGIPFNTLQQKIRGKENK